MEKYYAFAGVELSVRTAPELMYEEDRLLAPFRVQKVKEPHRFTFTSVPTVPWVSSRWGWTLMRAVPSISAIM